MIRFIIKRKQKLTCGLEMEEFYHIDNSVTELEIALRRGGFSEDRYDYHELIGVELLNNNPNPTNHEH